MTLQTLLVAVGSGLLVGSIFPYLRDIIRKRTKPRLVSWFNWTILTTIAGSAALSAHQYPAATISFASASCTLLVVILGWHHGSRHIEKLDIVCQLGAATGLLLWYIFNSPTVAVIAAVTVDAIAAVPTVRHAWQKPTEETLSTFAVTVVGASMVILAVKEISFTALTYPLYLMLSQLLISVIIIYRRKAYFI